MLMTVMDVSHRTRFCLFLYVVALLLPFSALAQVTYTFTPLNYPGATDTEPGGINNAGQISGGYIAPPVENGFLYNTGTFTPLTYPGATTSYADTINNNAQVVGVYQPSQAPDYYGSL